MFLKKLWQNYTSGWLFDLMKWNLKKRCSPYVVIESYLCLIFCRLARMYGISKVAGVSKFADYSSCATDISISHYHTSRRTISYCSRDLISHKMVSLNQRFPTILTSWALPEMTGKNLQTFEGHTADLFYEAFHLPLEHPESTSPV